MTNEEATVDSDEQLYDVLYHQISFKHSVLDFGWQFRWRSFGANDGRSGWLVWAEFTRPDILTDEPGIGRGREQVLWRGVTVSGVVKTAWVIFQTIVHHEMMHGFQFRGRPLFDPHVTVDRLWSISLQDAVPDTYRLRPPPLTQSNRSIT